LFVTTVTVTEILCSASLR